MNRWRTNSAEIIRAFLYAAVTAMLIVAIAYLLGREGSIARDRAYFEIHDHRIAAACANAEMIEGINRLLDAAGAEMIEAVDVSELDCEDLADLDLVEATPDDR